MASVRPRHALRGPVRLVLVAALLSLILITGLVIVLRYLQVDETSLPDLRGMQYAEAAALLRERSLVPVAYPDNVPGSEIESVTSQSPAPGTTVREGRSISVGVHRPPEASQAPVLVGLTEQQALNTARNLNLVLESVEYSFSSQPAGRVISQAPESGGSLAAGEGLSVVVSRGPEQRAVEMPDLQGMSLEAASSRLEELGFRSIELIATGVSFDSPGTVRSQKPQADERVSSSTPVILGYELPAREVVKVPELQGRHADFAGRLVRAAGLRVGEVRYAEDPEASPDSVLEVLPSGYTLRDTPLVLTVNAPQGAFDDLRVEDTEADAHDLPGGPGDGDDLMGLFPDQGSEDRTGGRGEEELGDSGRRVTVSFDPAQLGVRSLLEEAYDLRLVVNDDEGERTVIDRRVGAGQSVSAVVVVHGDALLQTYINGIFFQAWRP